MVAVSPMTKISGRPGRGEVRRHPDAPRAVRGCAQPRGSGRGAHAGGPQDHLGGEPLFAEHDALRRAFAHRDPELDFDPEALECGVRIGRQIRRESGQDARSGLDQHHPRLARIDVPELIRQRHVSEVGDGTGELDARGAPADDHEGEPRGAQGCVAFSLGALEGKQDAAPDRGRILERFQSRGEGLPLVVAEIGVARAGREHERVVADAPAVLQQHLARGRIDSRGRAEQGGDVLAPAKELTDRPGDFRGGERCRPDLVEQRLEQMVVALIDDGDAYTRGLQSLCDGESAEAAADDHHMMRGDRAHGEPPARHRRRSPPRSRHRDRRTGVELP